MKREIHITVVFMALALFALGFTTGVLVEQVRNARQNAADSALGEQLLQNILKNIRASQTN